MIEVAGESLELQIRNDTVHLSNAVEMKIRIEHPANMVKQQQQQQHDEGAKCETEVIFKYYICNI